MERYFIRNCLGQVVGNPKGYATYKGAGMIFNRKTMQAALIDLAHENGVQGSSTNSVLIGSIKLEPTDKKIQIVRVEDSRGYGMYAELWFSCNLPNDSQHTTVAGDSVYQANLLKVDPQATWEPSGHRFGFLNLSMLRVCRKPRHKDSPPLSGLCRSCQHE